MGNPDGAKEVPVKQTAIVVSVLAVGWLAIQFALKPFLNKKEGSSGSDKSEKKGSSASDKSEKKGSSGSDNPASKGSSGLEKSDPEASAPPTTSSSSNQP